MIQIMNIKKTQKLQYSDDDNQPVHSNEINHSEVVTFGQSGSFINLSNNQYKIIGIYKLRN